MEQVRHLLDETYEHVPLSKTIGRFPVLCGQVVGIEAVTRISRRPICAECLTAANLREAVRS